MVLIRRSHRARRGVRRREHVASAKLYLSWQYPRGERATILSEIAEHFRRMENTRGLGWVCFSRWPIESQYTGGEVTELFTREGIDGRENNWATTIR